MRRRPPTPPVTSFRHIPLHSQPQQDSTSKGMTVGKYLIIGGTGGIGRMLANRLVMKYHKVSRRGGGEEGKDGKRGNECASGRMD